MTNTESSISVEEANNRALLVLINIAEDTKVPTDFRISAAQEIHYQFDRAWVRANDEVRKNQAAAVGAYPAGVQVPS